MTGVTPGNRTLIRGSTNRCSAVELASPRKRPFYGREYRGRAQRPHPCFGCGELATKHFSLTIMQEHPSRSRIAAGVIDLCLVCWRQANESARIRKRPQRPRQAAAA